MAKHFENIVIGIPLVPCGMLLSDGTTNDIIMEHDKTYFTSNRNIAQIFKELGIVSSISEVRRNKPELCTTYADDYRDCLWVKWGKRKFYVIIGRKLSPPFEIRS